MVCPQKGLLVVQLPVPAFGVLSVVKIPPASTAKSAACACAKTDRSNEQKSVTSVLFKMTSQQNLTAGVIIRVTRLASRHLFPHWHHLSL